jgi:glycolate oxidase FAD binding subunit
MHEIITVKSVQDVCDAVRGHDRVFVRGAGTKPRLCAVTGRGVVLDMTALAGIIEYEPSEYTFTAMAGTRVMDIIDELARQKQYLPFDPMLAEAGATLGGMVASGLNGPGRLRYGGMRDFIIGAQFVDGCARAIRGGGKVVKNAAGFDFPKLLVGSLGRLGVMTELTFKVFPKPIDALNAAADVGELKHALALTAELARGPYDIEALDLNPPGIVMLRIAGDEGALRARLETIRERTKADFIILPASNAAPVWNDLLNWNWISQNCWRVKVPVTPALIPQLDARFEFLHVQRHYSVAGTAALLAWPAELGNHALHEMLAEFGLCAMALDGDEPRTLPGVRKDAAVQELVKRTLDPYNTFPDLR